MNRDGDELYRLHVYAPLNSFDELAMFSCFTGFVWPGVIFVDEWSLMQVCLRTPHPV